MSSTSKEIGKTGITVSTRGRLLKAGRSHIQPFSDPETGYLVFQVPDPETPSRLRNEYLHVHVFLVHSNVNTRKKLVPKDVRHIDGNMLNCDITNLELSPSGLEKVYGQGKEKSANGASGDGKPTQTPVPTATNGEPVKESGGVDPSADQDPVPGEVDVPGAFVMGSAANAPSGGSAGEGEATAAAEDAEKEPTGDEAAGASEAKDDAGQPAEEPDQDSSAEQPEAKAEETPQDKAADDPAAEDVLKQAPFVTAVKSNPKSNYYDILNEDGNSVLGEWNAGKKVNGENRVRILAEEKGFDVRFE